MKQSDGVCRRHSRKQSLRWVGANLVGIITGFLFATAGIAGLILKAVIGLIFLVPGAALAVWGIFCTARSIWWLIHPEVSPFGKSVIAQQRYAAHEESIQRLFEQIDADLAQGGHDFGAVKVGREWIIGSEALRLENLRGIFQIRQSGRGADDLRIVLADKNRRISSTSLIHSQWEAAYLCLTGLAPWTAQGGRAEYNALRVCSDREWTALEEKHRPKPAGAGIFSSYAGSAGEKEEMAYTGPDGIPTSRVDSSVLRRDLLDLQPGQQMNLRDLRSDGPDACRRAYCIALPPDEELRYQVVYLFAREAVNNRFARPETVLRLLEDFRQYRRLPDFRGWQRGEYVQPQPPQCRYLLYVDSKVFERFSYEDVVSALDGIDEKRYGQMMLARLMPEVNYGLQVAANLENGSPYLVTVQINDGGAAKQAVLLVESRDTIIKWLEDFARSGALPDTSSREWTVVRPAKI